MDPKYLATIVSDMRASARAIALSMSPAKGNRENNVQSAAKRIDARLLIVETALRAQIEKNDRDARDY